MQDKMFFREMARDGARDFKAGRIDRRHFLALCAMAGAVPHLVAIGDAEAAANAIVFWNWGGDAVKCHTQSYGAPFSKDTGLGFRIDSSGPLQGKIKQMVESGHVTADVADADAFDGVALGKMGHLEPIDYSIVDKKKVLDGYALEYSVSITFYGYGFVYDTEKFKDNPPTTWADFWDLKKYPGKRSLYKWANGAIEAALMADGVAKEQVYPCDVDRALGKIKQIKADTIYWGSASESQQMIVNGEVSMGMVWLSRAKFIEDDTEGRYRFNMNQAIAMPGAFIVPKGNPAGRETVMKFLASCQKPERQLEMLNCQGYTPGNPETYSLIPDHLKRYIITSKENLPKVLLNDPSWWASNGDNTVNKYLEAIS
ncbi:MAG: putative spermidine/putrescine transport system substrate-binding protein [Rhodospirillaceae bacterium]|nr:putative spermidine/putrescine transport system substrate-binding protein [Rhodospirillaceae bacterium]